MKSIKYYSKSDEKGKCSFSITMSNNGYSPGHPDGEYVERDCTQHFYANPTTHGFKRPEEEDNENRKTVSRTFMDHQKP